MIVSVAVTEPWLVPAEIVAVVADATLEVATVNVPVFDPEGIVIEAGTVAEALLEERVTTAPLEPAFAASVTVPVEE